MITVSVKTVVVNVVDLDLPDDATHEEIMAQIEHVELADYELDQDEDIVIESVKPYKG